MASCFLMVQALMVLMLVMLVPEARTYDCVTPSPNPNAPKIPKVWGNSYQAHIELNIVDKNKTWAVDEYLDYEGNRAARIISEGNDVTKNIFSFETDEIFVIKDNTCTVVNMSSPEASKLLFGSGFNRIPNGGDRRHTFGAIAIFHLASASNYVYEGKTTVRGIPANKWTECTSKGPVQMRTSYYFNDPEWTMPVKLELPVLIEVQGNIPNGRGSSGTHYFHHYYAFIDYRPVIDVEPTMFETPKDVVCSGRVSTKPLPTFGTQFQYMAENVDPTDLKVSHFSMWYDGVAKLVRIDKRDTLPQYPLYTTNPVTEIHDHNTGVRYIKDQHLGNCSVFPLGTVSADSYVDPQKTIEMSDPSRFFSFTKNYTYAGVRTVRGIECDVYSAVIHNYKSEGITVDAIFHYYFLSSNWEDQPLQGTPGQKMGYPLYLEIEVPQQAALHKMVNFFDFDSLDPDISVFDITDCFGAKNKLDFKIIFPGTYDPATEDEWKYYAHYTLADTMKLSPIRIGNLEITSNLDNVFLTGSLLGTSAHAQFQLAAKGSPERVLEKTFFSVNLPEQCADLCVKNKEFLCQGYQYCPADGYSCGLSTYHVLNQTLKTGGKSCDFFTRTVQNYPYPKEPTTPEAYDILDKAIRNRQVHLLITKPNGFEPNYIAVAVQKLSGYSETPKPMPSLPSQFSYRMETVVPQYITAFDSYVWYDSVLKVVRLDQRNANTPDATEFSTIHDFNLGITYQIDKVSDECMITPIVRSDDFDVNTFASKPDKQGGVEIKMKSPLEIFFMDDSYTYIGQKSVRGILCDAYQADRSDFHIKAFNVHMENSVFTIYFQADNWKYYTADSLDVGSSQPVQITIEDKSAELMMIYNVFDYDDEYHDPKYFDVSSCYTPDQKKSFELIFKNQPFHPFLDGVEPTFRNTVVLRMGEVTGTSPLRFQHVSVSFDEDSVYVLATVLGNVPSYTLFQPVTKVTLNSTATTIVASTFKDCSAACVEKVGYPCNSFDFCPDSQRCALSLKSDETLASGKIDKNGTCVHFSRSENGGYPLLDVDTMFTVITNMVYDQLFNITLNKPGAGSKTYTATDIRDDILISTDPASASGSFLRQFSKTADKELPESAVTETHKRVSITDCAMRCKTTTSFSCQTFEYSFGVGTCRLSSQHLDELKDPLVSAKNVDVYATFYIKDYKKYGIVLSYKSDELINSVNSDDLCARDCNEATSFKCESFVYCPDLKTCNLKKDHSLPANPNQQQTGQALTCIFYSRQHLYDYVKESNKIVVGHDDLVTNVDTDSDCARLCANGELKGCASFEVCQVSRGITQCRLSMADPTIQSQSLKMQTFRGCNLFTQSISSHNNHGSTPSHTTIDNKHATGSTPSHITNDNKHATGSTPRHITNDNQHATGSTPSHITNDNQHATGSTTSHNNNDGQNTNACTQKQSSDSNSDDTGARVGIAFGSLILGALVGVIGMFLFSRWKTTRFTDDTHQLREYNST